MNDANPKTDSDAIFVSTPGMPGFYETNMDFQLVRAMCAASYGEGGAVGECYATARQVKDGDLEAWGRAWSDTAARNEDLAGRCLRSGHHVSAREAYLRACHYWKTASFFVDGDDPQLRTMWERHRASFRAAAKLFDPPIEPLDIPYENGKALPGYFMKASADDSPRPTLMIIGGGDTTCEELYFWGGGAAAVRRGWNALLWEGPGQVGAYMRDPTLTYRPDYEVPARFVVDYALSRADVDPDRLALSGHSYGGYFAPRAAAFEKRIKAVIANALLPDCKPVLMASIKLDASKDDGGDLESKADMSNPLVRKYASDFKARSGMAGRSLRELFDSIAAFNLWGLEDKFEIPFLNICAAGEGEMMRTLGLRFFDKLTCPKTDRFIEGFEGADAHCEVNNPSLKHQIEFDWLDDVFGLARPAPEG